MFLTWKKSVKCVFFLCMLPAFICYHEQFVSWYSESLSFWFWFCGHHQIKQSRSHWSCRLCIVTENLFEFFLPFNNVTQRQENRCITIFFCAHVMHTWAPSYNQTLPSIYQIVNGLIFFFLNVDNTYINIYTHMFLICTHVCLSSAHSPRLLFATFCWHQVFWLVQSSVQKLFGLNAARRGEITLLPASAAKLVRHPRQFCRLLFFFILFFQA